MQKLNVGIVGLGIGEQHLVSFLENPFCRITRIADHNESKIDEMITKYKLLDVVKSSFDEIVKDPNLQCVSIASYDHDHYSQVLGSLDHRKHIFVEKPLCQTSNELKVISKHDSVKKVVLASNLVLRNAPLYIYIKDLIQQGHFGEIYAFDADYLYGRLHKITDGWRKNVPNYSVMEGGGIHMVDLMLGLTGQKPVSVSSKKSKIVTQKSTFQYPDFHSAVFSFSSGLVGRITANFGCVHPHQHVVRIFGTKATFIYDDQGPRILKSRDENSKAEKVSLSPKPLKKGDLIHNFVDQILKNDFHNVQRECELMSVVLAADLADESGTPLPIEYLP